MYVDDMCTSENTRRFSTVAVEIGRFTFDTESPGVRPMCGNADATSMTQHDAIRGP